MCRNVNLYSLETIIYGCNLDAYILNREPRLSFFIIINNIYCIRTLLGIWISEDTDWWSSSPGTETSKKTMEDILGKNIFTKSKQGRKVQLQA